jgi:hypothetical protein
VSTPMDKHESCGFLECVLFQLELCSEVFLGLGAELFLLEIDFGEVDLEVLGFDREPLLSPVIFM